MRPLVHTLRLLSCAALLGLAASCSPHVYTTSTATAAMQRHHTVAILPAQVQMQLRPNELKRLSPEQLRQINADNSFAYQQQLYSWVLRRGMKKGFTVGFQDVTETNALLTKQGITYENLREHTPQELARLLGVDAVLISSVRTTKPVSEGVAAASVAAWQLTGIGLGAGPTNHAAMSLTLNEAASSELLWRYDYTTNGSLGSTPESVVYALMRNASKKFPYRRS